ncbi:hypothetical protein [Pinisolibacter aquiterrae]|uniref:hypothetical protein n=1 Tax=Pinisolibacter aquiterrae TaxID=2815579 RepID=UPI001C3DD6C8|nr:hypothetical protein [Pinisolibacter aquiterrae]MBV5262985.1 hypothetical protein [Pinisolibacter aquiterrae]MCC8235325.1 hypothetical protein [Pinisolibacter aquiterrae]
MNLLSILLLGGSSARSRPGEIEEKTGDDAGPVEVATDEQRGGAADEEPAGGDDREPPPGRGFDGRFAAGNPGGPGRPLGMLNQTTVEAQRRLAEAGGSKIIARAIRMAEQGDPGVMGALLRHVLPKQRKVLTPFRLPPGELTEAGLRTAATSVLQQVAAGTMTSDEGRAAMAVIEQARSIVLADDLAKRVEALTTAPSEEQVEMKTEPKAATATDAAILRAWTKKAEPKIEEKAEPATETEEREP